MSTGPTRRTALAALAVIPLLAAPASAQFGGQRPGRGPLLGTWTSGSRDLEKLAPGEVVIYFRIDGLYQKRTGVANSRGYVEVIGTWHWDQKASELTWTPESYTVEGPALEPMGKRAKVAVELVDKDNVVLKLPGGPLRLKKLS